jgi:hypothetical protein
MQEIDAVKFLRILEMARKSPEPRLKRFGASQK